VVRVGETDGFLPPVGSARTHQQRVLAAAATRMGGEGAAAAVREKDVADISDVEPEACEATFEQRSAFPAYVASARRLLRDVLARLTFWRSAGAQ
jgi:hypothetical protein